MLSTSAFAKGPDAGTYTIDKAHTKITFGVKHMMISTVEGRFNDFSGDVVIGKKFTDSKFNAKINVNSIDTAVTDRDNHLKSADFFDAAKHPEIKFVSTGVTGTPESFKVTGDLTIKDVTKKVTLEGTYYGSAMDPMAKAMRIGYDLKGKINRQDFKVSFNKMIEAGPMVGDDVEIRIQSEAIKNK